MVSKRVKRIKQDRRLNGAKSHHSNDHATPPNTANQATIPMNIAAGVDKYSFGGVSTASSTQASQGVTKMHWQMPKLTTMAGPMTGRLTTKPTPELDEGLPTRVIEIRFLRRSERQKLLDGPKVAIVLDGAQGNDRIEGIPKTLLLAFSNLAQEQFSRLELTSTKEFYLPKGSACMGALKQILYWMQTTCNTIKPFSIPIPDQLKHTILIYHTVKSMRIPEAETRLVRHLRDTISHEFLDYDVIDQIMMLLGPTDPVAKHLVHVLAHARKTHKLPNAQSFATYLQLHPELAILIQGVNDKVLAGDWLHRQSGFRVLSPN
ncbi:hypothetical protein AOQ84DRAFT_380924 [Glonium stellatum]|uniref:BTB domain-containing protein n=1 Tax=Glonium stellatum TaxID=574774 RepID=A0A8E2JP17_9PEZI|nr:hypothetical protein AOQ84DRAFT_380924 [Glonium stellatum]